MPDHTNTRRIFHDGAGQPERLEALTDWYSRRPELARVLVSSVDHLWQAIVTCGESGASDLRPGADEKRALLAHAGLLRGINLAMIVSWRPSGDTPVELEVFYPGFLAFAEASVVSLVARAITGESGASPDSRAYVHEVAARSRLLLATALRRGYGAGLAIDAGTIEPAGVAPAVGQTAIALASIVPTALRSLGQTALADPETRSAVKTAVLADSRRRPLAIPANIARYSPPFLTLMLGSLLRRWMEVGLATGEAGAGIAPLAGCLDDLACAWARIELDQVAGHLEHSLELRLFLADLTLTATAAGWQMSRLIAAAPFAPEVSAVPLANQHERPV
ncbi:MAG: hypothetical protein HYY04_16620 [Chloroflexi bacterium]|nr:hypothetical protein [Chloroflexota bacterium]